MLWKPKMITAIFMFRAEITEQATFSWQKRNHSCRTRGRRVTNERQCRRVGRNCLLMETEVGQCSWEGLAARRKAESRWEPADNQILLTSTLLWHGSPICQLELYSLCGCMCKYIKPTFKIDHPYTNMSKRLFQHAIITCLGDRFISISTENP